MIGSISVGPMGSKYRAFAWPLHTDENAPAGSPLGVVDGDTLGHATFEMLRVIRGERGFDDGCETFAPTLFDSDVDEETAG
jgi:hypothetical protein